MKSNYIKFEELIVKPLCKIYGVPCEGSISDGIKRFLRPKDCDERKILDYKWGDWFVNKDFACFKIYGFERIPYILPKLFLDRIAYIEIVRKLSVSNAKHFTDLCKQAFLPGTLSFHDFTIVSTKYYDIIDRKLMEEYNLFEHYARKNYDPEGYIHSCKEKKNLGDYLHSSLEAEDMFRNMEDAETQEVIDRLNRELAEKRQIL